MINVNGVLQEVTQNHFVNNRGFLYGDAVFETLKTLDGKVLFLEDHYFRMMAAMRVLRMDIPMDFNMDFFEDEILKTIHSHTVKSSSYRVRMTCYRKAGGKYKPENRGIDFVVEAQPLSSDIYPYNEIQYEVELYKDFYIATQLLSTLKTNNRAINVMASIFADENDYANLLLINDQKNVIEAINGNIFLVKGNEICTPPIADGCISGIMRKKIIEKLKLWKDYTFIERSISPFELQKSDELWITNVITGIQPVTNYRKKSFQNTLAKKMTQQLNASIRLNF